MNEQRSRLAVPLVLGLLGGSASLIGCQSGQSQVNDGPSGSGLLPPPPPANGSRGDWLTPPWERTLPLSRFRPADDDDFIPPLPAA